MLSSHRKCWAKYHQLHPLDSLCLFLPTSAITTLAQNSFASHPHHHNNLLTPCWGTYFISKLQPVGSFLKASMFMSSPPPFKIQTKPNIHTQSARPARSGLLSSLAPPYPTPLWFLGSRHLLLIPLTYWDPPITGLYTCCFLSRMFFPLMPQTLA